MVLCVYLLITVLVLYNILRNNLRSRIFKQSIVRVEHVFGEEEEEFSCHSTIVKANLKYKMAFVSLSVYIQLHFD